MSHILVIDDDELIREMLSLMIEDMGHSAVSAGTLAKGFAMASSDDFDVIFLDIRMPDGNGLDLLPRIRELLAPPEVIIITGLGDPDGAELAIKNGAWDYITEVVHNEGDVPDPGTGAAIQAGKKHAQAPGGAQPGRHRKQQLGDEGMSRHAGAGGAQRCKRPHHGQDGHGQRGLCTGHTREQQTQGGQFRRR